MYKCYGSTCWQNQELHTASTYQLLLIIKAFMEYFCFRPQQFTLRHLLYTCIRYILSLRSYVAAALNGPYSFTCAYYASTCTDRLINLLLARSPNCSSNNVVALQYHSQYFQSIDLKTFLSLYGVIRGSVPNEIIWKNWCRIQYNCILVYNIKY